MADGCSLMNLILRQFEAIKFASDWKKSVSSVEPRNIKENLRALYTSRKLAESLPIQNTAPKKRKLLSKYSKTDNKV